MIPVGESPPPPGSGGRTPVVGHQIRRQIRHLLRVGRGRGSAVLVVSGEPGSGRTRLLESVAERARSEGFRVLDVGLGPVSAGRPYGAVTDLLRPLVADGRSTGRPVLTRRLDALDRIYGGPTRRPPTPLADRAAEQHRLFTDVRRLLRRACVSEPLLLVIDDLQWADPSSIALLRDAVLQPAGLPLRVIASVPVGAGAAPFRALKPLEGRPAPFHEQVELRRRRHSADLGQWAEQTLDSLDAASTEVLQWIGAAGGLLELGLLSRVCPAGRVVPAVATLRSLGLLQLGGHPHEQCRARSWVLPAAAHGRLSDDQQRVRHLRLLRAARELAPAETLLPAYHVVRTGDLVDPDERLALLARHAMAVADSYAESTAVVAAGAALLAAESVSEAVRTAVVPQLLDLRAESLSATGRPAEAIESWTEAAAMALTGPSTAGARRFRRLAETAWTTGRRQEAAAHADRAADALPATAPHFEHLAVQALRSRIRSELADGDVAEALAPLAELWRRTGWRGAEVEYKLSLEALAPAAGRLRRPTVGRSTTAQPPSQGPASP